MSERRSRSSMVEVAADPLTAFTVFTEELDLWWVRGPVNAYDSGRLVEMRCEPGVGGRILEVYDAASGEGLELARITAWQPGERLAWQSSLDDVAIDVLFEPSGVEDDRAARGNGFRGWGRPGRVVVRRGHAALVRGVDGTPRSGAA